MKTKLFHGFLSNRLRFGLSSAGGGGATERSGVATEVVVAGTFAFTGNSKNQPPPALSTTDMVEVVQSHLRRRRTGFSLLFLLCAILFNINASAQLFHSASPEKDDTRRGNKQFDKDNYSDAEAEYKKALDKKNNMPEAMFNLGDAVYKEKRYPEATQQFELSSQTNPDPLIKAKALHNLGNTFMEQRKWEDAVRSYKNALRWNPNDRDTKYNLAYANAMLRQKQNDQKNQKNDKKQDKKDKDKDQQQKQDQQNQKPDQGNDQKQQQADNKQQQQQKGGKAQLSKQDAEKLLQALNDEEQKTNQKVQKQLVRPSNVKILKDW